LVVAEGDNRATRALQALSPEFLAKMRGKQNTMTTEFIRLHADPERGAAQSKESS
jgi:hypothetical protein